MTQPNENLNESMNRINRDLGNLEGRLSSMEQRMHQNELSVNAKLTSIDQKVEDSRKEHKADLKALGDKQEAAISDLANGLAEFQNEVRDLLSQTKGGWKTVTWLVTLVAACAGAVTWILSTLASLPK